jgi:hypothetical protein
MIDEGLRALMFSKLGLTVLFLHLGRARDSRSHRPTADLCLRSNALGQFDPLLLKIPQCGCRGVRGVLRLLLDYFQ